MKHRLFVILTSLLVLFVIAGCGQSAEKTGSGANISEPSSDAQSRPAISDALQKESWPINLVPAELPEYTSGEITAWALDSEGDLTIKVANTSKSDLNGYLEKLRSGGWIVVSNDTKAEAVLGLYTVTFALQGADDTVLQIDIYTAEAASWPADEIPPDIMEPQIGVLVGKVEIIESGEDMWYFNYIYDDIDEEAAKEYMNSLSEKGWSGSISQMYKSFEWKGKRYEATIEINDTVESRTTFTCNYNLSDAEPDPQVAADPQATTAQPADTDASVVGSWTLGMLSGGKFSAATGKYEGGASGMGQIYTFKPDGTYTALVIFGDTIWITGKYSVNKDVLKLTGRTSEESKDGGKTWSDPETLPDASAYFTSGTDNTGMYLLLGGEGEEPPLVEKENAMKYRMKD